VQGIDKQQGNERKQNSLLGANKNNSNCHSQFPKHAQGKSRENRDEYKDG
jgi:hypothetical protein